MNSELIEAVNLTTEERLTSNIIMGLIDELPDLQKAVLIAYYYDGFSIKEIAKMQECPEDTVKSMLDYARNALDDKLEAKERKEGIKLQAVTFDVLRYAVKLLAEKTTISSEQAKNVYEKSSKALGFAPKVSVGKQRDILRDIKLKKKGVLSFGLKKISAMAGIVVLIILAGVGLRIISQKNRDADIGSTGTATSMLAVTSAIAEMSTTEMLTTEMSTTEEPTTELLMDLPTIEITADGTEIWPADYFEYGMVDDTYYVCTGFSEKGYAQYSKNRDAKTVMVMLPKESTTGKIVEGFYFVGGEEFVKEGLKNNLSFVCVEDYACCGVEKQSYYDSIIDTIVFGDFEYLSEKKVIENIKNIVIRGSVKTVGDFALNNAHSLESVIIESGVELINEHAFRNCVFLKYLQLGEGIKEIRAHAFDGCVMLESIKLPDSIKVFGTCAFYGCSSLLEIVVPGNVESIGVGLFGMCTGLKSVIIEDGVPMIAQTMFVCCENLESVVIPESVKKIGERAFNGCNSLKSITIPTGVEAVDLGAFANCTALESIVIPKNVTTWGVQLFEGCTSLKEIIFEDGITKIVDFDYQFQYCKLKRVVIPASVEEISENTFHDNKDFIIYGEEGSFAEEYALRKRIEFVANEEPEERIEGYFYWPAEYFTYSLIDSYYVCTGLSELGVEEYLRYKDNDEITIVLPKQDTRERVLVGFYLNNMENVPRDNSGCKINIVCPEGYYYYGIADAAEFYINKIDIVTLACSEAVSERQGNFNNLSKIIIPEGVYSIRTRAFVNCEELIYVEIPNSMIEIMDEAFKGCTALRHVIIPERVSDIKQETFANCISLEQVEIKNGVDSIQRDAFKGCTSLTEIVLPESVYSIYRPFDGCTALKTITVLGDFFQIMSSTLFGDIAANVTVHCQEGSYTEQYIRQFDSTATIIADVPKTATSEVSTPEYLTWPADYFTYGKFYKVYYVCTGLSEKGYAEYLKYKDADEVTIGMPAIDAEGREVRGFSLSANGQKDISDMKCNLNLICPESYSIYNIDDADTYYINIVKDVTLSVRNCFSVRVEGNYDNVRSIIIPEGVRAIAASRLLGCDKLESVVIPSTVESIGHSTFRNCTSLKYVQMGDGIKVIDGYAFANCTALTDIALPASVYFLGKKTFDNCTSLKTVTVRSDCEILEDDIFNGCNGVTVYCSKAMAKRLKQYGVNVVEK